MIFLAAACVWALPWAAWAFDTNALPSGLTLAEYLEICTKIGSGEISINRIVNANYDIEAQLSTKIELTVVQ